MFVSAILAATLAAGIQSPDTLPQHHSHLGPQCVSAERTGTFRVTTQKPGGRDLGLGLIVLENIDGCLEATFITDNAGPAIIDGLSITNGTLNGALRLSTGSAKVSLRFEGTSIAGSIVQGRNEWSIAGRKTS